MEATARSDLEGIQVEFRYPIEHFLRAGIQEPGFEDYQQAKILHAELRRKGWAPGDPRGQPIGGTRLIREEMKKRVRSLIGELDCSSCLLGMD